MKLILAAILMSVACAAQSRCVIVKYQCDPPPDLIMFTILDCAGNVIDFVPFRLASIPCLGQAQYCVPLAMGNVRIEAVAFAGIVPVGSMQRFNVGCP